MGGAPRFFDITGQNAGTAPARAAFASCVREASRIGAHSAGMALANAGNKMASQKTFARILVPVDFSSCSEHALRAAFAFAAKAGARLDVLHVWEPSPYVSPTSLVYLNGEQQSFWDHMRRELSQQLNEMVKRCRADAQDVVADTHVEAGYASSNILEAAARHDLVVMGTHGRGWLAQTLLGSVAARVVRSAPCPVLTVKEPKRDDKPTTRDDRPPGRGLDTPTHL